MTQHDRLFVDPIDDTRRVTLRFDEPFTGVNVTLPSGPLPVITSLQLLGDEGFQSFTDNGSLALRVDRSTSPVTFSVEVAGRTLLEPQAAIGSQPFGTAQPFEPPRPFEPSRPFDASLAPAVAPLTRSDSTPSATPTPTPGTAPGSSPGSSPDSAPGSGSVYPPPFLPLPSAPVASQLPTYGASSAPLNLGQYSTAQNPGRNWGTNWGRNSGGGGGRKVARFGVLFLFLGFRILRSCSSSSDSRPTYYPTYTYNFGTTDYSSDSTIAGQSGTPSDTTPPDTTVSDTAALNAVGNAEPAATFGAYDRDQLIGAFLERNYQIPPSQVVPAACVFDEAPGIGPDDLLATPVPASLRYAVAKCIPAEAGRKLGTTLDIEGLKPEDKPCVGEAIVRLEASYSRDAFLTKIAPAQDFSEMPKQIYTDIQDEIFRRCPQVDLVVVTRVIVFGHST
jgi:hypothetical protein